MKVRLKDRNFLDAIGRDSRDISLKRQADSRYLTNKTIRGYNRFCKCFLFVCSTQIPHRVTLHRRRQARGKSKLNRVSMFGNFLLHFSRHNPAINCELSNRFGGNFDQNHCKSFCTIPSDPNLSLNLQTTLRFIQPDLSNQIMKLNGMSSMK